MGLCSSESPGRRLMMFAKLRSLTARFFSPPGAFREKIHKRMKHGKWRRGERERRGRGGRGRRTTRGIEKVERRARYDEPRCKRAYNALNRGNSNYNLQVSYFVIGRPSPSPPGVSLHQPWLYVVLCKFHVSHYLRTPSRAGHMRQRDVHT